MKTFLKSLLLSYFVFLAKLQLKKYSPDTIGVTGSAGKTSTVHAIATILQSKYNIKVTYKANSEWGIPANILGLPTQANKSIVVLWLANFFRAPLKIIFNWQTYEKFVVEMGIDSPKPPQNMSFLLTIIQPRTAILLNVTPTHSENFDYLCTAADPQERRDQIRQAIADEKGKLITQLPPNGLAVLNKDDPFVRFFAQKTKAKVFTFGTKAKADLRIGSISHSIAGTKIEYIYQDSTYTLSVSDKLLPKGYAYSFAAALCIGLDEDISIDKSIKLLQSNFQLPPGRSSLIPGKKGSIIIDSTYNAATQPMLDILDVAHSIRAKRILCIIGDMREMGQEAPYEHQKVARKLTQVADHVCLIGPLTAKHIAPILKDAQIPHAQFPHAKQAAEYLLPIIKPTDIIVVKGSQNTLLLEIAVEALMRRPQDADQLLCRRGAYWDRKRSDLINNTTHA